MKHEGSGPTGLSRDQLASLAAYEGLLRRFAIPKGIIASSDEGHLRSRHILDSLRAAALIESGPVADLGSGAGLPGVPIAVARPDVVVTLTEPRQARAAFLELVTEQLDLSNARVFPRPAEELARGGFAACLARGFGDVARTWTVAEPALAPGGAVIYWAGRTFRPGDPPSGARLRSIGDPALESGGPIVIMTRQ